MIGWIDASSGASGDMLLAAVIDAGVSESIVAGAVTAAAPETIGLSTERVRRGPLTATRAHVETADSTEHRGLGAVTTLVERAGLEPAVTRHATAVFVRLAEAEAAVHGVTTDEVHFHEVGALDAIADIVGVCAGLVELGLDEVHCSPVAVGSGQVDTAHGRLSVPPPAVAALLRGVPTYAGPTPAELCTPTGAALLSHWVDVWGPQPAMRVELIGMGAGGRDFETHPNVLRLFVGPEGAGDEIATEVVYETNVDDLDPRLWPVVLQRLLDVGASDAWLTPILMKKGRPAHTLSVLTPPSKAESVRGVILTETSAIGLRALSVGKHALDRETAKVEVKGHQIRVKVARSGGAVVNVQPEYDDIAAAASALGRPAKAVMADAVAAAAHLWQAH